MSESLFIWKLAAYGLAILYLAYSLWRGWRRGLIRALTSFGGLIIGFLGAWFCFQFVVALLSKISIGIGVAVGLFIGCIVGIALYIGIRLLGVVLLKKTAQQSSTLFRLLFGMGGALVDGAIAILVIFGIASMIDTIGSIAQPNLKDQPQVIRANPVLDGMAKLREALGYPEKTNEETIKKEGDTSLTDIQDLLGMILRLSSDPDAAMRLLDYPGMHPVMDDPHIVALSSDPEIVKLVEEKNFIQLLSHPKIWQAIRDPELIEKIKKVDIHEALREATTREDQPPGGDVPRQTKVVR